MKKQIIITLIFLILLASVVYCTAPTVTHYGLQIFNDGITVTDPNTFVADANGLKVKAIGVGVAADENYPIKTSKFTVDPNGAVTAGSDTDTVFTFGRGKMGYLGAGLEDYFAIGYYDKSDVESYGFCQHAYETNLNCETGGKVKLKISNQPISIISSTGLTMASGKTITQEGLIEKGYSASLADEASISLSTGITGWGEIQVGDDEEFCRWRFKADGTVTEIEYSSNIAFTDSDTKFCIYDGGLGVVIKNRLGSSKNIAYKIHYRSI